MRVLITGGAGHVGRPVTEAFVRKGWDLRVCGIEPAPAIDGISYTRCDILDYDRLLPLAKDCDAIAHLAAIPSTLSHPNHRLFDINVAGTFNVFAAAEHVGIKRVAQASSINALGGYWGCDDRRVDYFPLDEAHPTHTTDAYSLSKQLVEEIAAYFWRRSGISSVSFRFPAVWSQESIEERGIRQRLMQKRDALLAFRRLPSHEQQTRLAAARQQILTLRARHVMEYQAAQDNIFDRDAPGQDPLFSSYFFDRYNYWTFIHSDDSTQAFERGITCDYDGAHPLFVNSDRNYLGLDSEELLAMFFPDVPLRTKAINGDDTMVSFDRARDLLGYAPTVHSVI